jgi:hypothetical protein
MSTWLARVGPVVEGTARGVHVDPEAVPPPQQARVYTRRTYPSVFIGAPSPSIPPRGSIPPPPWGRNQSAESERSGGDELKKSGHVGSERPRCSLLLGGSGTGLGEGEENQEEIQVTRGGRARAMGGATGGSKLGVHIGV